MVCVFYHIFLKKEYPTKVWVRFKALLGSMGLVKNCTFGFNLNFDFFSQCSLHIHASYSISQKLNVPMAPLSEPNAVGIVIAHGKQPSPPSHPTGRSSWLHWNSATALKPVRKSAWVAFTILCRMSYMMMVLWVFHRLASQRATWLSPFPNFQWPFCPITGDIMGNNGVKVIQNYSLGRKSSLFPCWFVLRRWRVVLQVAWEMPSQWWSRMCTSHMMGVTPGRRCWKDPTITPSWIPEASSWPLSTAAILSMWLSMHELSSAHTIHIEGNCGKFFSLLGSYRPWFKSVHSEELQGRFWKGLHLEQLRLKLPLGNTSCHF